MHVCVLTTSYPRWEGDPSGSFVADLVGALLDRGDVSACVLAPGDAGAPALERRGRLTVRRLSYAWPGRLQRLAYGDGIPWNLRRSRVARLNVPFFLAAFARALPAEARRADVVHAHWGILGALAVLLRPVHRRPVAVTVHGSDLRTTSRAIRAVTAFAVRHADAVLTPSGEFHEACCRIRGTRAGCHFVPHGVPCPPVGDVLARRHAGRDAASGCRVVTVGRLIPERRHDLLVRAFARAAAGRPADTLRVVGDGVQMPALRALVEQLGLARRVELVGRVPPAEVLEHLRDADLYVSPTTVDNFGTAVVEAAAQALPVITTRVGFPAELVVAGRTGRVVPPDDEDALAEALSAMLSLPPEALAETGRRMRARVDELGLTWPAAGEKVAGILADTTRRRRPPPARR